MNQIKVDIPEKNIIHIEDINLEIKKYNNIDDLIKDINEMVLDVLCDLVEIQLYSVDAEVLFCYNNKQYIYEPFVETEYSPTPYYYIDGVGRLDEL